MIASPPAHPIAYSPAVETIPADEPETIRELDQTIGEIQAITEADEGVRLRGVHVKGHALLRATLTVAPDLAPELAQGLFAGPGRYDAVMRFSTAPGDMLSDAVSSPRGLAIKILDVAGDRLPNTPAADGQDFIMVNGPRFGNSSAKRFLSGLKALARTTGKAEGLKHAVSAALQTIEGGLEAIGRPSSLIAQIGGTPNTHPLGESYFTQVPSRYGDHIAKWALIPISPHLTELTGRPVDTRGRPDALREDIAAIAARHGGVWELRVQLCTDLEAMPIEDPSIEWDQQISPYRTVARVEAAPQPGWEGHVSEAQERLLAFSPWHGLEAFRPLGGINRARKSVYAHSQASRGAGHGCPFSTAGRPPRHMNPKENDDERHRSHDPRRRAPGS